MGVVAARRRDRARRLAGAVPPGPRVERRLRGARRDGRPGADRLGRARPARGAASTRPGRSPTCRRTSRRSARSTDVALVALAEQALGAAPTALLERLQAARRPSGQIGETLNSTMLGGAGARPLVGRDDALRARAPGARRRLLVGGRRPARLERHGSRARDAARRARAAGRPVARAVAFLLGFQRPDGGFELTHGRGSDAQSTAWAIQGLVAAGRKPPRSAFAYLARLKQHRRQLPLLGRLRTTPVWVTSQVLAALAKKPFPLAR